MTALDPQRQAKLRDELTRLGLPIAPTNPPATPPAIEPALAVTGVTGSQDNKGGREGQSGREPSEAATMPSLSGQPEHPRQTITTPTISIGNGRGYSGRKPVTSPENRPVTARDAVTTPAPTTQPTAEPAPTPAPPIEPVELVRRVSGLLRAEVVMTHEQALFAALWALFAHAHDNFETSPILAIMSAVRRSGKTRLLERIHDLVPRPLASSSAPAATIFRVIEKRRPTLLLDELDMAAGDQAEFNRILISGLRRKTASVLRCVGNDFDPKEFSTWCPKVVCRIGDIRNSSLNDRAIIIRLTRATSDEVDRLQSLNKQTLESATATLRAQAAEWAAVYGPALPEDEQRRGELPMKDSRYQDLWAPLLAIADMIGGDIGREARAAALALYDERETATDEQSIRLLLDIRDVFEKSGSVAFLPSGSLVASLREEQYGLWSTIGERGLNDESLAYRLRSFGIKPKQQREGNVRKRGYFREAIEKAIVRYAPAEASPETGGAA